MSILICSCVNVGGSGARLPHAIRVLGVGTGVASVRYPMASSIKLPSFFPTFSGHRLSHYQSSRRNLQLHECRALEKPEQDVDSSFRNTLEVLKNDIVFLEGRTGLDLQTPLANVALAHDELVALLNPIAGDRMQRELEEQIAGLQ